MGISKKKLFRDRWLLELWESQPSFLSKPMFGGLAAYLHGKLMLMLVESPGDRNWRGKRYSFDLWDGLLICTSKDHHEALGPLAPDAIPHPILPKWLYLPRQAEGYEEICAKMAELALKNSPFIGVVPKERKPRRKSVGRTVGLRPSGRGRKRALSRK